MLKVKQNAGLNWQKQDASAEAEDDTDAKLSDAELLSIYRQIAALLQPKETVARALRRFGGAGAGAQRRPREWKKRNPMKVAHGSPAEEGNGTSELKVRIECTAIKVICEIQCYDDDNDSRRHPCFLTITTSLPKHMFMKKCRCVPEIRQPTPVGSILIKYLQCSFDTTKLKCTPVL